MRPRRSVRCAARTAPAAAPRRVRRGFTLVELVAVMMIIAVLAVVALPRLDVAINLRSDAYRDQIVAALRLAGHTAVGHRRLVCVQVAAQDVSLSIAAANPATACGSTLPGPVDGSHARAQGAATSSLAPAGTLYFQPGGRITTTGAGSTAGQWTISVSGATPITVTGETGHVD